VWRLARTGPFPPSQARCHSVAAAVVGHWWLPASYTGWATVPVTARCDSESESDSEAWSHPACYYQQLFRHRHGCRRRCGLRLRSPPTRRSESQCASDSFCLLGGSPPLPSAPRAAPPSPCGAGPGRADARVHSWRLDHRDGTQAAVPLAVAVNHHHHDVHRDRDAAHVIAWPDPIQVHAAVYTAPALRVLERHPQQGPLLRHGQHMYG
jgi:hypothetical protein